MKRAPLMLLTFALTSVLLACDLAALGDSPEKGAQEWMQAFASLDGNKIADRTCAAQQANVQQAGLWSSVFNLFGQQTTGQQAKTDISGLKYTTVSSSGNTASVRVTGQVRVAILALSQAQEIDETWRMTQENGKWKWCGQVGASAPPTAPVAKATPIPQDNTPYDKIRVEASVKQGGGNYDLGWTISYKIYNTSSTRVDLKIKPTLPVRFSGGRTGSGEGTITFSKYEPLQVTIAPNDSASGTYIVDTSDEGRSRSYYTCWQEPGCSNVGGYKNFAEQMPAFTVQRNNLPPIELKVDQMR